MDQANKQRLKNLLSLGKVVQLYYEPLDTIYFIMPDGTTHLLTNDGNMALSAVRYTGDLEHAFKAIDLGVFDGVVYEGHY